MVQGSSLTSIRPKEEREQLKVDVQGIGRDPRVSRRHHQALPRRNKGSRGQVVVQARGWREECIGYRQGCLWGYVVVFVTVVKYQSPKPDLSLRRPFELGRLVAAGRETPGVVGVVSVRFKIIVSDYSICGTVTAIAVCHQRHPRLCTELEALA